MPVTEIRLAGFGGQGVILSAIVIGKAACIYQNGYSTMTQNFGPEARGGACSAQVILSDKPVLYPYVIQPDILVVMSQEAYTLFSPQINPNGILVIEEDLVRISELPVGVRVYSIPATRIAEELGKKMVLNIVMVGFFAAVSQVLDPEAVRNAVAASVPEAYRDLNLKAFDRGFDYGSKELTQTIVKQDSRVSVAALEL
ncbi:MAG TPA: 2-oxoacid:acceptor oxidoreductase family protein [Terriglobales bacterium]|jgi:2-oxoglutarate ferredoxin oxidoreductase subunit gamma